MEPTLSDITISTVELIENTKKYFDLVEAGEKIYIKRNGIVVAVLMKAKERKQ